MNLPVLENELKKRCQFEYKWFRKQHNSWDRLSSFIYTTSSWDRLNENIALVIASEKLNQKEFFQYCSNRWYNFWSARAAEHLFAQLPGVVPNKNPKDKKADFCFFGNDFDLKTSVFPNGFRKDLAYAQSKPKELIFWLYKNQSKQNRFHLENRLFLVVYAQGGQHWKLKSEISFLKQVIEKYVATFEASQLKKFQFQQDKSTLSDVIWAVK